MFIVFRFDCFVLLRRFHMSTVVLDGLSSRMTAEIVQNFCQNYGRILNCYVSSDRGTVTFGESRHADEFVRASPHRIDSTGSLVTASWSTNSRSTSISQHRSINESSRYHKTSIDDCRLLVRGSSEQLDEKQLIYYFSRFGSVRMCISNQSRGTATVTFDDRTGCERARKELCHFLNGRSLTIEPYSSASSTTTTTTSRKRSTISPGSNKRAKLSSPSSSSVDNQTRELFDKEKQFLNEQQRLERELIECKNLYEQEKQRWTEWMKQQGKEIEVQIMHYQHLLSQSLEEMTKKDATIEQLKQENKDIDDLLRQSVHDNEQQQIHLRKREETHNQTKRKYEELYKAYIKLKDTCNTNQREKEKDITGTKSCPLATNSIATTRKSTVESVKKKL